MAREFRAPIFLAGQVNVGAPLDSMECLASPLGSGRRQGPLHCDGAVDATTADRRPA
jgi:hypothetical protein